MRIATFGAYVALALPIHAHPEAHSHENAKREAGLVGRATGKCAAAIEARKVEMLAKRAGRLRERRFAEGKLDGSSFAKRNELKYTTIQNDTCVLAPDTVWGPYGIDGEMVRHDLRELSSGQEGLDFYLDIGLIDIETCNPLPKAALTIWNCNSTGTYSGYTGVNPDTVELLDGWTKRSDGTTDDETFLRGVQITDSEGMVEFLTLFPGYYVSRTTHIHVTVQTNITNGTSYSASDVQHIGQLFFDEDLINSIYQLSPYKAHLSTLNRTTNAEDSLYNTASSDGYSAIISVSQIGDTLADGLVGYITIGVNASAAGLTTTGGSVNVQGVIPTVSVGSSKYAEATAIDRADGYTS
ncbi:Intradiol ring-cleavage dioxygenase [Dactylonectria macrodidyma]|uniref:Intradiol ring-cleavage dioxygenase n=1 Tax=Dactylonectria macrodidyma TaxID=307937 RepID=A0A9P9IJR3_9HYPO|nr:Intradiol ring-cleavage dioxygenase [Dactylonectria macrodidyma]